MFVQFKVELCLNLLSQTIKYVDPCFSNYFIYLFMDKLLALVVSPRSGTANNGGAWGGGG